MDVRKAERLKVNLVLIGKGLLASDEEFHSFANKVEGEVQLRNLASLPQADAPRKIIAASKQRVAIIVQDNRASIEREYPDYEDLPNFAKFILYAIEDSKDLRVHSHGYNVEITCKQTSFPTAYQFVADRVLKSPDMPGWNLREGGTASLRFFDEEDRRWTVEIAPRFNLEDTDVVYLSFNLHLQGAPNPDEIESQLELVWKRSSLFLEVLK